MASQLLGIEPSHMLGEAHLLSRNPDILERRNLTWAYPPVLLLKASEDYDTVKERIDDTRKFFQRQVRLSIPLQTVDPRCHCLIV